MASPVAVLVACLAVASLAPAHGASQTVADIVSGSSQLTTLTALLSKANLVSALSGAGPFSVFAPTDAAFAALPSYVVTYLTAPENAAILTAVLEYHVSNTLVTSYVPNQKIPSLQGSNFFVEYIQNTRNLGLADATCDKNIAFVGGQAAATNGLVQVIDTVMFPPGIMSPDQLFWAEQRGAGRVGFDGWDCRAKGSTLLSVNEYKPVGLAVDSNTQMVFWSNDQNAQPKDSWISMSYFNSSGGVTQVLTGLYDPQGMDVDPVARKLYYTEHQGNTVSRANYDGSLVELIYQGRFNQDFPADVAVDHAAGLVFITIQSVPTLLNGSLAVMNLDKTGFQTIKTGLIQNYGLCVDTYARHVYYIQGGNSGSISCHAYGSTPCNTANGQDGVILDNLQYPYMCTVDNMYAPYGGPTKIAFSEPNVPGSVYSVYNNGSNVQLVGTDMNAPMGVKLGTRHFFA